MTITETDIVKIKAMISPMLGQKAWDVSLGHGSFITLEFGTPVSSSEVDKKPCGEWHLWVYCCAWRLEDENVVLASSEDSRSKLKVAIQRLEGRELCSVELLRPAWDTIFIFTEGVSLRLFSIHSEEYQHWMLFMPNGNCLVIGPGSNWSCESD